MQSKMTKAYMQLREDLIKKRDALSSLISLLDGQYYTDNHSGKQLLNSMQSLKKSVEKKRSNLLGMPTKEKIEAIRKFLARNPLSSVVEISQATGLPRSTIVWHIRNSMGGSVKKVGYAAHTKWTLVGKGENAA